MTADEHVDADALAEAEAGWADRATSRRVAEHLARCEACRSRAGALREVTATLRQLPHPTMPEEVSRRIDAALAATSDAGPTGSPTVVPLDPGRRARRTVRIASLAAVAAGVALVGALIASHVVGGGTTSGENGSAAAQAGGSAAGAGGSGLSAADVRALRAVETVQLPGYTSHDLASRVADSLSGTASADRATNKSQPPQALSLGGSHRTSQPDRFQAIRRSPAVAALAPLRSPTRMFSCIRQLTASPATTVPLSVQFTTYAGKPAVVVVVPNPYQNSERTAFVAGPRCGAPDAVSADLITYVALPR